MYNDDQGQYEAEQESQAQKVILDLCGGTGAWSRPYKEAGYDVRNITLPDYDVTKTDIIDGFIEFGSPKGDNVFRVKIGDVYGILAAPPCQMFSLARTKAKTPRNLIKGMETVRACLEVIWRVQEVQQDTRKKTTNLKFWALENPYAMLKFFLGKPAFIFDPWEFGDGYQKKTALWGYFNEPKKKPIPMTEKMKKLAKTNSYLLAKTNSYLHKIKYPKFGSDRPIEFRFNSDIKAITPAGFAKAFYEANK